MGSKLFVGNLAFTTTTMELKEFFGQVGTCESATVITDRATGRSRGFGFVEMSTGEEAARAVAELNSHDLQGRSINVSEARERAPRSFGGPGGGGGGGGGGDFGSHFAASEPPQFRKGGGSRRGLRGKKRSIA
jgi:RNA recognition motif-containing protein